MTGPERVARGAIDEAQIAIDEVPEVLTVDALRKVKEALRSTLSASIKAVDFCSAIEI